MTVQTSKFRLRSTRKQSDCLELLADFVTKYILFGGGAGGGKSWLGCQWLLSMCLTYPGVRYFMGREELKSLKDTTVKTFFKVAKFYGVSDSFRYYEHYGAIKFNNGSEISLIELKFIPSDPMFERFGSTEYTGGFIDEAGEIHFNAFDALKARIGRQLNELYNIPKKILLTCNPKKNWLYFTFYKPWRDNVLEAGYRFIQSLVGDNNKIDKGYVEGLDEIKDATLKKRLKYGEWDYEDDPLSLVDFEAITNIFTNEHVIPGKQYITADVARFGADKIIIRAWNGLRVQSRTERQGLKITETAALIRSLANQYHIPMSQVIVDEDGVGGGVVDILKCKGFVAGSSPLYHANFNMLKSQCGYRLSELINENLIFEKATPQVQELLSEELGQLKRMSESSDKKQALMPKEKIKDLIGRSPDDLDTYIMRAYWELKPFKSQNGLNMSFHK